MAGGGKASGQALSGAGEQELASFSRELREQSKPMRDQLYSQMGEALTTGGVNARIPIVQRSVEASNAATSEAMRGLESEAAANDPNFAKSPFYQRMRADIRQEGLTRAADVGPSIARGMIEQAPSLVLGTGNTTISGLSTGAEIGSRNAIARRSIASNEQIAKMKASAEMFSSFIGAAGKASSGMG